MHPDLLDTVRRIHAKRILVTTKKEEMLGNFKLSTRGSIRRAPNVVPETYFSDETVSRITHLQCELLMVKNVYLSRSLIFRPILKKLALTKIKDHELT